MSAESSGIPRRRERPAERTDPMLPVIVDGPPPPGALPPRVASPIPALDDASVAEMIAELEELGPVPGPRPAVSDLITSAPCGPAEGGRPAAVDPAPRAAVGEESLAPGADPIAVGRYVRRDLRPVPVPAEAPSLTGLSRYARGKLGSRLFTVIFLAILVLIVVQTVASLLSAA